MPLLSAMPLGALILNDQYDICAANPIFLDLLGYRRKAIIGRAFRDLTLTDHTDELARILGATAAAAVCFHMASCFVAAQGERVAATVAFSRFIADGQLQPSVLVVLIEPSALPLAPRRAEHLLHYDALTKLPNRLLFESRLEHALELCHRNASELALFLVDLDRFSHLNASLGQQLGDELLRVVALRLREAIRPADTLARLRADQFGLLFEAVNRTGETTDIARRLQATLSTPIRVRGHEVFVTASIGIAVETSLEADRNAMLAQAESALHQVKQQGRNGFRIALLASDAAGDAHRQLIGLLRTGLDQGDYRLLYHPQVNLDSGVWQGVTVALHWEPRAIGPVPPERFLPLANESGIMFELGQWALATACRQLQAWLARGLPVCTLAIPIAEAQLIRGDLLLSLKRLLADNPLVAPRLELVFSELLLQKHPEQVAEVFNGLHRLGVRIALSDVGSGWVAPAVLRRLPVNAIIIHAEFIEALPDSADDLAIVQAVIAMAQALELDSYADGVRTDAQRVLLATLGCQQAQGQLFGESMSFTQIERHFCALPAPPRSPSFEN